MMDCAGFHSIEGTKAGVVEPKIFLTAPAPRSRKSELQLRLQLLYEQFEACEVFFLYHK